MKKLILIFCFLITAVSLSPPLLKNYGNITASAAANSNYNTLYTTYTYFNDTVLGPVAGSATRENIYWNGIVATLYMYPQAYSGNNTLNSGCILNWSQVNIYVEAGPNMNSHSSFTLYKDGEVYNTKSLSGKASTVLYSGNLPEGIYTFFYYCKYVNSLQTVAFTYSFSFIIDRTPPSYTLKAGGSVATGTTVYTNQTIIFSVSDAWLDNVYVKHPGMLAYTSYSENEVTITSTRLNGWYYFYAEDKAGNVTPTISVYLDTSPPTGSVYSNGSAVNNGSVITSGFSYSATDSGSGISYLQYRPPSSAWTTYILGTVIPATAANGQYDFRAVDKSGNVSAVSTVYLDVPPTAQVVYADNDGSVYITWADNSTGKLNGNNYIKGTWITKEGSYTFIITNTLGLSTSYQFTVGHYYIPETIAATCTESGSIKHICSCGDFYHTDITPATGHEFTETVVTVTCTESGGTKHTCLVCGFEYLSDAVSPGGHIYDSQIISSASCINNGERHHVCEKCGDEYTAVIPALGHNYIITEVIKEGKITKRLMTCTYCGDSYIEDLGNQYEKIENYVIMLFNRYSPYMVWVFLGTAGIWSVFIGIFIIIAQKNEEKEKARRMLINYAIGLVAIFAILVACPLLIKGIAALVT